MADFLENLPYVLAFGPKGALERKQLQMQQQQMAMHKAAQDAANQYRMGQLSLAQQKFGQSQAAMGGLSQLLQSGAMSPADVQAKVQSGELDPMTAALAMKQFSTMTNANTNAYRAGATADYRNQKLGTRVPLPPGFGGGQQRPAAPSTPYQGGKTPVQAPLDANEVASVLPKQVGGGDGTLDTSEGIQVDQAPMEQAPQEQQTIDWGGYAFAPNVPLDRINKMSADQSKEIPQLTQQIKSGNMLMRNIDGVLDNLDRGNFKTGFGADVRGQMAKMANQLGFEFDAAADYDTMVKQLNTVVTQLSTLYPGAGGKGATVAMLNALQAAKGNPNMEAKALRAVMNSVKADVGMGMALAQAKTKAYRQLGYYPPDIENIVSDTTGVDDLVDQNGEFDYEKYNKQMKAIGGRALEPRKSMAPKATSTGAGGAENDPLGIR